MLIRIVRMTFKEDQVENFLTIFNQNKDKIRHFEGCTHLSLLRDYTSPHIFTTYSHWKDEKALDKYRHSPLFKKVWANTKIYFGDRPIAFSLKKYLDVD
ncbi:putative quinol monooxygenase [Xanthovirga aplysinae]|uniref:putative quinol monooxygenase n=1 Tax=Xanthovirga aplysinae TaxID=2529853 RepID=UPI0012BCF9CD|nr:antibiotic biosynthesis monooxygenase [Xanthovirga aplysinae]MTI33569.1 antibiotic biosynthesis monooxygenase [Xanthovirga aplysinae]